MENETTKPNPKPRIASAEKASQAAGAAPTLRYGPAGDSAPRLRLKASWYGRKAPFRPVHGPNPVIAPLNQSQLGR